MPTTFQPLYDRIIVLRDDVVGRTEAGIILPDAAKEPPNIGVVVECGEGRLCTNIDYFEAESSTKIRCHVEPLRVSVGNRVMFQSYAGTEIMDRASGKILLLMKEDDVLAIIHTTPDAPTPVEPPANNTLGDPNE